MAFLLQPALAAAVALALLYGPALPDATWVHDDGAAVTGNPLVAWPPDLQAIAAGRWFGPVARFDVFPARPLATLSYCLEIPVGLHTPVGARLANLVLAWACCLLLARLVRQWMAAAGRAPAVAQAAAWLAAVGFAVHPLHVEVVANAANRPEALALALSLGVLEQWTQLRLGQTGRLRPWLAALLLLAALLSKESALALVAVLVGWMVLVPQARSSLQRAVLPAAIALGTFGAWRIWNLAGHWHIAIHRHDNPLAHVDAVTRIWSALAILGRAAASLLLPSDLAPDYSFDAWPPLATLASPGLAGLGLLALAVAAVTTLTRRAREAVQGDAGHRVRAAEPALVAALALAGWWLPVSNLVLPSTVIWADRLLFAPSAAALAVLAALVAQAWYRPTRMRTAVPIGVLLALGGWSTVTARYVPAWHNDLALFSYGVHAQPRALRMQANLAHTIVVTRADRDPRPAARAALALDPRDPDVWATGMDAAAYRNDCAAAEPFAQAVASSRKRATNARLAALAWGMRCKQYRRAFGIASGLPPQVLGPQRIVDVYALAIAAGQTEGAGRWAQFVGVDPTREPMWQQAQAFGAQLAAPATATAAP